MPTSSSRRGYIDYLRGLAILIMIEAHVTDSWTGPAGRAGIVFGYLRILSGFAAPLFLFLAGLSAVLAANARDRKTGDARVASRAVQRRGWEVVAFAFLFRFQEFALHPKSHASQMLKVDILNIMGPCIVLAALLWLAGRTTRGRLVAFAVVSLGISAASAWVRQTPLITWLPDPVLNYFKPLPGRDTFNLFPWAAFVFAGAFIGVIIDHTTADRSSRCAPRGSTRSPRPERGPLTHALLTAGGVALAVGAYFASFLSSPIPGTQFWTTSPAFFLLRVGILVMALGLVYFQHQLPPLTRLARLRPMQQFGRSSLFVYWIHVDFVYGVWTRGLHAHLSMGGALAGVAAVGLGMYVLVVIKDEVKARIRTARQGREETRRPRRRRREVSRVEEPGFGIQDSGATTRS